MEIAGHEKKYRTSHNIVYGCPYYVIFCPKYRRKVLTGEVETRLKERILEKQADYGSLVHEMEVMPDPVHWDQQNCGADEGVYSPHDAQRVSIYEEASLESLDALKVDRFSPIRSGETIHCRSEERISTALIARADTTDICSSR